MKFFVTATLLQLIAVLTADVPTAKPKKRYDTSAPDLLDAETILAVWTPGQGGIKDTCALQQDVLAFTVQKLSTPDPKCMPFAAFRVCMQLRLPEDRRGISKTCVKNSTETDPKDFDAYNPLEWASASVGVALGRDWKDPYDAPAANYAVQCQIGCSGNPIDFEIVDGYKCRPTNTTRWPDAGSVVANTQDFSPSTPLVAECHSRPGWKEQGVTVGSCTCSAYDQDCVWRVPLPTVPFEVSPSPTCSCPPMSPECDAAKGKLADDGYGNDLDVVDCADPQAVVEDLNKLGYGCAVAGEPGCKTIKCDSLVTKDVLDQLSYGTCPVQSPRPL